MALLRDLSASQLVFQVAGGTIDQFQVIRYRGTEGLCQLYRFDVDVACSADVDVSAIMGSAATLSINSASGEKYFHGIVSRFELTDDSDRSDTGSVTYHDCYYRIELVPTVWLLSHRYQSRIYQEKTTKEIITDVLTLGGIQSDRFRFELSGTYAPREYCVQYRETDYNFICRLLEEEGIFWFFEQTADGHILVMADSVAAYQPIAGTPELRFVPASGMSNDEDHVFRFRMGHAIRPGKVTLRDFNFKTPKVDMTGSGNADTGQGREFSDFPGEYDTQGRGQTLAAIRMEEFNAGRVLALGQSTSQRMSPSRKFSLTEHPVQNLNAEYVITRVTHQGKQAVARTMGENVGRAALIEARVHQSLVAARQHQDPSVKELADALLQIINRFQTADPTAHRIATQWLYHSGQVSGDLAAIAASSGGNPLDALSIPNLLEDVIHSSIVDAQAPIYECRFECLPSAVMYRPPRVTPWPVMRGSQTARVTGPSGEEIHTDEYGRVKVQFHWDREGKHDDKSSCWIRVAQQHVGGQYGTMFIPRVGWEVVVDFLEGDPDQPLIVGCVYNADHMPPYALPEHKTRSVIKTRSSKGGGGSHEIRFEDLKDKEQMLIYGQKDLHMRFNANRVETIGNDRHLKVGRDRIEEVKRDYHLKLVEGSKFEEIFKDKSLKVDGMVSIEVGGTSSTTVGSDVVEDFKANHKHDVASTYALKAMSIKLEASTGIELKCGGSSVILGAGGVWITGPMVFINSGSGPPVSPPTCAATMPEPPIEPWNADTVKHGTDTTYSGGETLTPAEAPADIPGYDFPDEPVDPPEETTWIDIQLNDEEGNPVPGEKYRVTDSAGKVHEGSLDAKGYARVIVPPGDNEVTFPDLDESAWEREA